MKRSGSIVAFLLFISTSSDSLPISSTTQELRSLIEQRQFSGASRLSPGTFATARAYLASADVYEKRDPVHAERMIGRVRHILAEAEKGVDSIAAKRSFFWRGYATRFASEPQLYSIYVPRRYDPDKKWPLIVTLHGGSSNHNVWMAMLLDNPLTPSEYRRNFRTPFRARVHQGEAIIVAPQGMGQNHWLGEAQQDVMDVIADVKKHYSIDDNKVFLNGLSNGAVATYKIGLGNAWHFAGVLPMSGFVDWEAHASGGASLPAERIVFKNESPLTIAENAFNTNLIFYHGVKDSGFNVSQARRLHARLSRLGILHKYHEITKLGHHLTHLLWRDMRILSFVRKLTRNDRPEEVRVVTATERANRQFWVVLDDRLDHRYPGRARARVAPDGTVRVETENVRRLTLRLNDAPVPENPKIRVDGETVSLETVDTSRPLRLVSIETEAAAVWQRWDGRPLDPALHKRAGLSGPIGDAAWEAQLHVYGTQVSEDTPVLREAARLGARGLTRDWEFTQVRHPVVADTELTYDLFDGRVLVLYGNAKNNSVLRAIGNELPIPVGRDYIVLRDKRLTDSDIGAKFICPNPLRADQYLVVQAGVSAEAVERAGALPMFLADYVVFNRRFRSRSQKMAFNRQQVVETGFFTENWQVPVQGD